MKMRKVTKHTRRCQKCFRKGTTWEIRIDTGVYKWLCHKCSDKFHAAAEDSGSETESKSRPPLQKSPK